MPDNPAISRLAGSSGPATGNNTRKKGSPELPGTAFRRQFK